ncbi:hypothetical protein ACHAPE_008491 [Trichoderma viride]
MDAKLEDSTDPPPTTCQENVDWKSLFSQMDNAAIQEFLQQRVRGQQPSANSPPTPSLKDPSVVGEYLAIKRLINEGSLTASPDTTIRVGGNGRWRGSNQASPPFNYALYPDDLYISASELTRHYTFSSINTSTASNIEDGEEALLLRQAFQLIHARPYTAHPVWNSVVKRGATNMAELKAIVEEAGKIEEADCETFEESLLYCDMGTRPGPTPLEDLPCQMILQKLLSALHRLCGEPEDEAIFSNMTEIQSYTQSKIISGVLLLRDPENARSFIQFIDMIYFCITADEIPECVTVLVQEHAEDLLEITFFTTVGPKPEATLDITID